MDDILEGQAAAQGSLDMLKEEANRNCMTLNKDKCKVLPVARKRQCSSPACGAALQEWLQGPDGQLNMGPVQLCSLEARMANSLLEYVSRNTTNRSWEGITSQVSALVRPHLTFTFSFGPQHKKNVQELDQVQQRAPELLVHWSPCHLRRC